MSFDPELADIRFGCGLSPVVAAPKSSQAMLDGLTAPDAMAQRFEIESFETFLTRVEAVKALWKTRRETMGTPESDAARAQIKSLKQEARRANMHWLCQSMLRRAYSETPFRERLTSFWADHFTAKGKTGLTRQAPPTYVESALRPLITGRFADLLIASVTHPLMLDYLDQRASIGPNSVRALGQNQTVGLNENLAREVLELHTLGVDGPYKQADVLQLAKLFTGMTYTVKKGFRFRKDFAEPGAEIILGKNYGPKPSAAAIFQALEDLATHPVTAAHIARKLAVHFVSDTPGEDLVRHLEATFLRTGGELQALYAALLEHPAAWDVATPNVKWPTEFIGSALRALAVPPDRVETLDEAAGRKLFYAPLRLMGQRWQEPVGPDGWPEADSNWISAQSLSARITWAIDAPARLLPDLPDPRAFAQTALGARMTPEVQWAASASESKAEAIGLVLASPAFQRC